MTEDQICPDFAEPGHAFMKVVCQHCGETIDVPVYCGNRFCPVCSVPRRVRVRNRLEFLVANTELPPHFHFKHLTLTIPNQPDLYEMVRYIVKSFRKLRNRAFWKNYVDGGAFVLEVTGRPNNWHVHIHTIIISRYLDWNKLLKAWIACSKGRGVWLTDIPASAAVGYLTKYLSKPSVPDLVLEYVNWALKGMRLFSPFGCWYALNLTYKKPKSACPVCGQTSWLPLDLCFGNHIRTYEMDTPLPEPEPERCPLTSELSL